MTSNNKLPENLTIITVYKFKMPQLSKSDKEYLKHRQEMREKAATLCLINTPVILMNGEEIPFRRDK